MKPNQIQCLSPAADTPALDYEEHAADFRELGITEREAAETILQSLSHIMAICVDIGWGVDIVHIMLPELFRNVSNDNEHHQGGADDQ